MFQVIKRFKLSNVSYYTTKTKRTVILQDKDKFTEYELRKKASDRQRVYVWGFAETGALGVSTNLKKSAQRHTALVHHPTRLQFGDNCDVLDLVAGYGFSVFSVSRSDGETLFGTGLNGDNQLGLQDVGHGQNTKQLGLLIYPSAIHLPKKENETDKDLQVKSMSAGRAHLVVLTSNGTIFSLGNNSYGQCGRPIVVKENYKQSGYIHRIEHKDLGLDNDQVVSVKCGQDHTLLLTQNGRVLSCGWGADGQTSRGNFESTGKIDYINGDCVNEKIVKVSCAGDCVLALNDKGDVFGWGNSEYGQLDNSDGNTPQFNSSRYLKFLNGYGKIVDIAAGGSFCMMLNDEGDVFTWGYGILGFGPKVQQTSEPKRIVPALFGRNEFSQDNKVIAIDCGIFHMAAINKDGDLFMWGKNRHGCLGLGHTKDQFYPFKTAVNGKIKKISLGVDHSLAICKAFI